MVDGYRIHRVLCERPGLHTLAEGVKRGGERVTLDAIATPLKDDSELRRRISRLARVRGSIDHPNVLRVIRTLDGGQRLHLQALPATATTLAERLRAGPLPKDEALRILGQVAGALETARLRGLAHRQLSPRAIFVTGGEHPGAVLTDFGIGAPRARTCELAGAVADAAYRAPEELSGEHPDAQTNVYTLACILVECLTGEPPFAYDRPLLTLHAHLTEPPPKPSERRPELPAAFDSVVATAMSKDRRERQASPGALIRAAEETLGLQVPIPVVRPPRPRAAVVQAPTPAPAPPLPAPRPRRRRLRPLGRAPAWAGVALIASAVAGFAAGDSDSPADPAAPALSSIGTTAPQPQTAVSQSVNRVMKQLDDRRTAARRRLQAARTPKQQAASGQDLAAAYRDARTALSRRSGAGTLLLEQLHEVEAAYDRLSAAARAGDSNAWDAAREDALDHERDLELLLRTRL
jgi:serine/threonine-protein kinase